MNENSSPGQHSFNPSLNGQSPLDRLPEVPQEAPSALSALASEPLEFESLDLNSNREQADVAPKPAEPPQRYVRQRAPHKTQPPVDDLIQEQDPTPRYTHDSNVTSSGPSPLSGMPYRRSRNNMRSFQRNLQYGQYLEIPKGRRSIFASRERARRRRSVLALLAVIFILLIAGMFIWNMLNSAIATAQ